MHKTANVLNKLPKSMQPKAKARLHEIWQARRGHSAEQAFDAFVEDFEAKYPKAVACLVKDRDALLAFYDFPAEHWMHIRTTNPIESTFATVRLRHRRRRATAAGRRASPWSSSSPSRPRRRWRKLNGHQLIPDVIAGVQFIDGVINKVRKLPRL